MPGLPYPVFRLAILGVGRRVRHRLYSIVVAYARRHVDTRRRQRPADRVAIGVDVQRVFALVFAAGASLPGSPA